MGGGGIERLLEGMARLRDPEGGCPWDVEQSFDTSAPYTIEEAYEADDESKMRAASRGQSHSLWSSLHEPSAQGY